MVVIKIAICDFFYLNSSSLVCYNIILKIHFVSPLINDAEGL